MLNEKKIVIGITGSIAAYKTPILVRQLIKAGAEVKIICTPAALDFVSKLTLSTVAKNPVLTDLFDNDTWANHVQLGRWADILLIAPLSCNTLSKMATGGCDNLLMATYLSAICPVVAVPAMDEDMWHHPTTKNNITIIQNNGCTIIPVDHGELASGLIGDGRMAEPEAIVSFLINYFNTNKPLQNKKVLITAGPTYEAIDPVRFIGNHSSGKMGYALAKEFSDRGAEVTLISGPVHIPPVAGVDIVPVTSAQQMYEACLPYADIYDIAVMAAAVADFAPANTASGKIKKTDAALHIELKKTTDILATLGKKKHDGQILIGFALETDNETEYAQKKLHEKNADMIVLNSLNNAGAGFGHDTNKITLFKKDGSVIPFATKSKAAVAKDIVDSIVEMMKSEIEMKDE
jgi:phosphopantothenoylcysteine decarboxylase/phosphopantothenate--cysteine ligase